MFIRQLIKWVSVAFSVVLISLAINEASRIGFYALGYFIPASILLALAIIIESKRNGPVNSSLTSEIEFLKNRIEQLEEDLRSQDYDRVQPIVQLDNEDAETSSQTFEGFTDSPLTSAKIISRLDSLEKKVEGYRELMETVRKSLEVHGLREGIRGIIRELNEKISRLSEEIEQLTLEVQRLQAEKIDREQLISAIRRQLNRFSDRPPISSTYDSGYRGEYEEELPLPDRFGRYRR